jgi:translation initiation factor 3 subunit B
LEGEKARPVNKLLWSPNGSIIVLAKLAEASSLEFYDVDSHSTLAKRDDLSRIDYLKWDPSGRYLTDAIQQPMGNSYYKYSYDNGFRMWTFQGTLIAHVEKNQFYMFQWRPRPPSLLTAEQQRKVKKDLRKYERRFDKEDREKEMNKKKEEWRRKGSRRAEFRAFYATRLAEFQARKAELVALQKGYDDEELENYEIRVVTRRMVPLGDPELAG